MDELRNLPKVVEVVNATVEMQKKKKKNHSFTALLTHPPPVGVVDAVEIYPWKVKQECLHGISGCLQML